MNGVAEIVQSVAKAAAVLMAFTAAERVLTIRDIALQTGIPRSTVHTISRTLVESGLLETRPDGGLQLGVQLAMLGGKVIERQGLVDRSQHAIQRHLDRFGVEIAVAEHIPGAVFYVYRRIGVGRGVPIMNRTGRRWAIHASGNGRAILATMAPALREKNLPATFMEADRRKLEQEIDRFAVNGYLVTDVSERHIVSVAAPIFDASSLAIGAIGCGDSEDAMTRQRVALIGDAVRAAAADISRQLGCSVRFPGQA